MGGVKLPNRLKELRNEKGLTTRELDKHIELAGVRHISAYNFRHTSITLLIKNGVDLNIVSKRAGHSSISITMNHYWHLFKGDEERALKGIKWGKNE